MLESAASKAKNEIASVIGHQRRLLQIEDNENGGHTERYRYNWDKFVFDHTIQDNKCLKQTIYCMASCYHAELLS